MSGIFASDNIPIEIDANDRDTHPDVPPSDRSAYEYSIDCSFQALHSPDIGLLVEMLQKHHDFVGFSDKILLLSNEGRELLVSTRLWDPFAKKAIIGIKSCLTKNKTELGKMKKQLVFMERLVVREFASSHAAHICSVSFLASSCQAPLNILASAFISILKHDMCRGVSSDDHSISGVVDETFTISDVEIEESFRGVGDCLEIRSLLECLY